VFVFLCFQFVFKRQHPISLKAAPMKQVLHRILTRLQPVNIANYRQADDIDTADIQQLRNT
jgi:hypothetical protein